jgi:hypothetical protein
MTFVIAAIAKLICHFPQLQLGSQTAISSSLAPTPAATAYVVPLAIDIFVQQ